MRINYDINDIIVDEKRMIVLERQALSDFNSLVKNFGSNFLIGYSGGKDSVVVSYFALNFGINNAGCDDSFCFPEDKTQMREIAKLMNLNVKYGSFLNDDWLLENPKYIFPYGKDSGIFYSKRQQRTIKNFAKGFTGLITGRRHQENFVKSELYKTADGLINFHPLSNWRTEEIWSFIKWKNLPYLSIYSTPLGKQEGATPWCNIGRDKMPNKNDCWELVYQHDKDFFVNELVKLYPQARIYYETIIQKR